MPTASGIPTRSLACGADGRLLTDARTPVAHTGAVQTAQKALSEVQTLRRQLVALEAACGAERGGAHRPTGGRARWIGVTYTACWLRR